MPVSRPTRVGLATAVVVLGAAAPAVPLAQVAPPAQQAEVLAPAAPTATTSWTARILEPVAGRSRPSVDGRVVGRLMHYTAYSRRPQILMVTGSATDAAGRGWVRVQLPRRPNGSSAWVPTAVVQLAQMHTRIRVNLGRRTVEVLQSGAVAQRFKAAVGTGGTPTPVGLFAVQDPVTSSSSQRSYLGPYIITLTAYSPTLRSFMGGPGLIALHGTSAPQLLGQAVSHGCIRVANSSVSRLWRIVKPGMPVEITRT